MAKKHTPMFGSGPVVVAVDGTPDGVRAVDYAVRLSPPGTSSIRIVHVAHETVPMAPMLPLFASETLRSVAEHVVADATEQALQRGAQDVEGVVAHGPRVPAILDHCADASLIVVGPRASKLDRLLTGSTSSGLAARAAVPVLCVPAEWTPGRDATGVVAGVDGSPGSARVLQAAFEAAGRRRSSLTVLHAWRPPGQYDALIVERVLVERWRKEVSEGLTGLVTGLGPDYPEVPVDLLVEYESTKPALLEASQHAELMVIGRHGVGAPFGLSLGSVARSMIHGAHCPVEIIPVTRRRNEHRHLSAVVARGEPEFAPMF